MGSCPDHGMLLEERPHLIWAQDGEEAPPPLVAHPDLLFLDGLTLQAITLGAVVLPNGHRLHGGRWLRMVRALLDELCLTITEAQQASATLRIFWTTHGLGYRAGVRPLRSFAMHPPDRQRRLLTVAGTAIRMLCDGHVVSRSPGAMLLAPSTLQGHLVSRPSCDRGGRASTRDASAPPPLGDVLQQWIARCRTTPASAAHRRQWLLVGYRGHPEPETSVDPLLTELGIPLGPPVTFLYTPPSGRQRIDDVLCDIV